MLIDTYPLIDAQLKELKLKNQVLKLETEWNALQNDEQFDANEEPIVI